jgi:integrase/recombinase XerD
MDHFLRHARFARGLAESTTKSYAGHLRRFEEWRLGRGYGWEDAAREIAGFLIGLRITPRASKGRNVNRCPSDRAVAPILAAVHEFYRHGLDMGFIDMAIFPALFEMADFVMEDGSRITRPRARLRVGRRRSEPDTLGPPAASIKEFVAMVSATTIARDACMLAFMGVLGLRVGQVASLRREDVHLIPIGHRMPGCAYEHGPHLHIVRRAGQHPRGAISKAPRTNVIPVPRPAEQMYGSWLHERATLPAATKSPWAFVSFPGPTGGKAGEALSTRRLYGIVTGAANDAGLRHVNPHMLRHTFGTAAADLDIARDVLQRLLGHESVDSQDVYRRPSEGRVIEAALRIGDRLNPQVAQ